MLNRSLLLLTLFLGLLACPSVAASDEPQETKVDFDSQVAPLIASRCLECHRGLDAEAGIDLSRREPNFDSTDHEPVLVSGDLETSRLWQQINSDLMPPEHPLSAAEKSLLAKWIEQGAHWGVDPIDPFRYSGISRAGYDWWAFQPVTDPPLPEINLAAHAENPWDLFLLQRLTQAKILPSPSTDRRTLLRRLSYDLLGLPPSYEEVREFENDPRPDAYQRWVDRYLASPHYGERWARHWLDVARYGETDGFERNGARPNAWRYRDWVIRALNSDLPYDTFAQWQLAGDVLEADRHNQSDATLATGYLVAGVHNTVLGNDMMRAVARQDELEDLVGNVGQAFLGLTTNCARCHDHKFDPISQTDYYQLASALSGVTHGERAVIDRSLDQQLADIDSESAGVRTQLQTLTQPIREAIQAERGEEEPNTIQPLDATLQPIAAWDLRQGLTDLVGESHLSVIGEVPLNEQGAHLNPNGYLKSAPLSTSITARTFEAWVQLDDLSQQGGAVIGLQAGDGTTFDAMVYAELEPGRWMAGSNFFNRTASFQGIEETDAKDRVVHVAIVYHDDGTISGYRDGVPYGSAYRSSGVITYAAGQAMVVLGCRHEPPGGNRMLSGTLVQARIYDQALSSEQIAVSAQQQGEFISEADVIDRMDSETHSRYQTLQLRAQSLIEERQRLNNQRSLVAYVAVPSQPPVTRLLARGDVTLPGDEVAPGGIQWMKGAAEFDLPADSPEAERRRRLADWIASADNPLFARVMVNRIWHHHFGGGLIETPNDFGFNGGVPSHPELLDRLASDFVLQDFSIKGMHRRMVTTDAYQRASSPIPENVELDAESRWLWRRRPLRLDGESLRDSLLSVSGNLNQTLGGKGFSDYQVIDVMNGTTYYEPMDSAAAEAQRRSIYRFTPRGGNQGLLDQFDCPDPAASAPRRNVTTTPIQALSLWNDPMTLRLASALAQRIEHEKLPDLDQQIQRVYQLTLQRLPSREEAAGAQSLADRFGLQAVARVLFNSSEFLTVE